MKNRPIIKINSREFPKSFLNYVLIFGKVKQMQKTFLQKDTLVMLVELELAKEP